MSMYAMRKHVLIHLLFSHCRTVLTLCLSKYFTLHLFKLSRVYWSDFIHNRLLRTYPRQSSSWFFIPCATWPPDCTAWHQRQCNCRGMVTQGGSIFSVVFHSFWIFHAFFSWSHSLFSSCLAPFFLDTTLHFLFLQGQMIIFLLLSLFFLHPVLTSCWFY